MRMRFAVIEDRFDAGEDDPLHERGGDRCGEEGGQGLIVVDSTVLADLLSKKKAFSGELVSQDPDDEPASELLARIRAERDAQ